MENHITDPEMAAEPPPPEVSFAHIDRRQIQLSRIISVIVTIALIIGVVVGLAFLAANLGFGVIWYVAAGAGLVFAILMIWLAIVWPVWEFDRTLWRLSETGLEIHRGVFWRHRISIPVARVQHADVSQGPLQRHFQLGKLTVHTAGTQNASVELEGLAHEQAVELRDRIVSQRNSADVV